jgi:transcription-repair coupling factor (superfamily II helicase)
MRAAPPAQRPCLSASTTNSITQRSPADFPFEETPDQQRAIDAVIADMLAAKPMDRLVCGDVGFGKTEVAMRAAFKARGRRQAGGHPGADHPPGGSSTANASATGSRLPGEVPSLNRSGRRPNRRPHSPALADGRRRHHHRHARCCSRDVKFKPRPAHGRRGAPLRRAPQGALKALRAEVDMLTMSATPIPRTLNMA